MKYNLYKNESFNFESKATEMQVFKHWENSTASTMKEKKT